MPLNAGDAGPGLGRSGSGSGSGSESTPLLMPEPAVEQRWRPMNRAELETQGGTRGWRRARCYLVLLFWLAWAAMLAVSVVIIVQSPRPVVTSLRWWQKSLFYQVQEQGEGSESVNALCEQLPHLRSLGIGALILEGMFEEAGDPLNISAARSLLETLPQIRHLLQESSKAGLKVVLDVCEVKTSKHEGDSLEAAQEALRFWLEQGVAGFALCDTDAAYSQKTLQVWRQVLDEFSSEEEERIIVVKQMGEVGPPLNVSGSINETLVDVVMRSLLPLLPHLLSEQEVAHAIEGHLQTSENIWPSWTVGGKTSHDLKNLLLVLMMTLRGSPAVPQDEDIDQTQLRPPQNVSLQLAAAAAKERNISSDLDEEKVRRSSLALFTSLSRSRSREEALLYGAFTFLPFNSSSSLSSSLASPESPPILAFLRSWGCVHFLVLLNVGSEPHSLDPAWAPSLPQAGVFIASTLMDRQGSTSLYALQLRPHEAIVIKLFETGSYSQS